MKNILITSISKKTPLLKAVREAASRFDKTSLLVGADLDERCIGRYFVDRFWPMPLLDDLSKEQLLEYCTEHGIRYLIPTRDGELIYFAEHKEWLCEHGVHVMVSDVPAVKICLDKLQFYKKLTQLGYPVILTSDQIKDVDAKTFVVKERFGAGAAKVGLHLTKDEASCHAEQLAHPVFQPYVMGQEASVDLYVDAVGHVKGCIARMRELVSNGESQITTTFRHEQLEEMCSRLAEEIGLYGHVMFQVMIDEAGHLHIVECNCRFGGASTLSVAAGLDSFYWFLKEASGESLDQYPFVRSSKEKRLVRYPKDLIL